MPPPPPASRPKLTKTLIDISFNFRLSFKQRWSGGPLLAIRTKNVDTDNVANYDNARGEKMSGCTASICGFDFIIK